jgi:hypothetical protein
VRDDRDRQDRPGPLALNIMARATIHRLKADCDELAKLYAALSDLDRERLLVLCFGPEP